MAKTDWEEWIKANILEIIILVLVLVLVFNTLGPTEEGADVTEEAVAEEGLQEEAPTPPEDAISEEGVGVIAEEPVPEVEVIE